MHFLSNKKWIFFFYSNSLWVVVRIVEAAAVVLFSIVVWVMSFYREKTKKLVTSNQITLLLIIITCYCFYSVLVKLQRDHIQHYTRLAIKWACISVPIIASKLAGPSSFDWGNNWDWDTGSLFGNEKICP